MRALRLTPGQRDKLVLALQLAEKWEVYLIDCMAGSEEESDRKVVAESKANIRSFGELLGKVRKL